MLSKITRSIYPVLDDPILEYLNDDGLLVEPLFYAPIIPMVLVNGTKGIGTGFSTDVMCYNPLDIIDYIKNKLTDTSTSASSATSLSKDSFIPYYEGFKGTIRKIEPHKFLIKGVYETIGPDKIKVTELPIGLWTEDFKELLERLIEPDVDKTGKKTSAVIKDYDDMSKDTNVDFTITFAKGQLSELEGTKGDYDCNGLEKMLKLYTTNTDTNMHLFNANDKLYKYSSVEEIIDDYYVTRLQLYQKRKDYIIDSIEKELVILSNKAKYITEILNDTIDLRNKKREEVTKMLQSKQYNTIENDAEYKYLIKMPMDSVTEENVKKLYNEHQNKEVELKQIKSITTNQMWLNELDKLQNEYMDYKEERERMNCDTSSKKDKNKKKSVVKCKLLVG
jgi:DNA topoisomerase-2